MAGAKGCEPAGAAGVGYEPAGAAGTNAADACVASEGGEPICAVGTNAANTRTDDEDREPTCAAGDDVEASASVAPLLVKLCGMRTAADVAAVNAAAPDFAGFVVEVPGKRRSVTIKQLRELTAVLSPAVRAVGVFVNAPVKTVHRLLADGTISAAQLHGGEDNAYIAELRQLLDGDANTANPISQANPASARIVQAFRVRSESDLARAAESAADLVLLDSGAGSGRPFDWQLLQGFPRPFLLAGGLGPDNIAQAAAAARTAAGKNFVGVDMSSGIETKGVKNPTKMNAAVAAAKGANR